MAGMTFQLTHSPITEFLRRNSIGDQFAVQWRGR